MSVRRQASPLRDVVFSIVWVTVAWNVVPEGASMRWVFLGVGMLFVLNGLRRLLAPSGTTAGPPEDGPLVAEPVDGTARLGELARELIMPGGRGNDEIMREAAECYAQLPPEARAQLDRNHRAHHGLGEATGPLAPDDLSGPQATAHGTIAEGWYRTADGSRERWHDGAGWTAHERTPGAS